MSRGPRRTILSAVAAGLLASTAVPALAGGPPSNDNWASARTINPASLPFVVEEYTAAATTEVGELASQCAAAAKTIWFRITLGAGAYLYADTLGSGGSDLSVWKGSSLPTLTEVECNHDANDAVSDGRLTWHAKAHVTYYVRVGGGSENAVLRVRRVLPPANDAFANATHVGGLPYTEITDLTVATRQPGEPAPACARMGRTIWYRFRPVTTMVVQADTLLSGFDTWIVAYQGTTLGSLVPLACDDDLTAAEGGHQSSVAWTARAGQTYSIQVGGYDGESDQLVVRIRKVTPPANDAFAHAQPLPQNGHLVEAETRHATIEAGEPFQASCGSAEGATVWYRFKANSTTTLDVDVRGTPFSSVVSVYEGTSLGGLSDVTCSTSPVVPVSVVIGHQYRIQVGGGHGDSGHVHIHLYPD